ncbi:Hypothetical predicted protein [Drosophila guanche]|uniref:Uncharacterized protein n=1 Tax=Drosophila guanche TaxID=7266 RepID=A0A3B0JKU7_DROGU|nr:Hypothetical predicted protein [Drosophila guanche]
MTPAPATARWPAGRHRRRRQARTTPASARRSPQQHGGQGCEMTPAPATARRSYRQQRQQLYEKTTAPNETELAEAVLACATESHPTESVSQQARRLTSTTWGTGQHNRRNVSRRRCTARRRSNDGVRGPTSWHKPDRT